MLILQKIVTPLLNLKLFFTVNCSQFVRKSALPFVTCLTSLELAVLEIAFIFLRFDKRSDLVEQFKRCETGMN